jgi:hypothetical protein
MTELYNVCEALSTGRDLTPAERDIHDRGLVTLIRNYHRELDEAVCAAYDFDFGTSSLELLEHLVSMNRERAAEEAQGHVRWLRPDFQTGGRVIEATAELELLTVGPIASARGGRRWPKTLPEQVAAVAEVLQAARSPLTASEIANGFAGKRARSIEPLLEALAMMGQARRLSDARYAA